MTYMYTNTNKVVCAFYFYSYMYLFVCTYMYIIYKNDGSVPYLGFKVKVWKIFGTANERNKPCFIFIKLLFIEQTD